LTGEGIAISLAAADELANCLVADRPLDYNLAWRKASRRYRLLTHTLVQARRLPVVPRTITPLAGRMPWLFAAAVDQLAREKGQSRRCVAVSGADRRGKIRRRHR